MLRQQALQRWLTNHEDGNLCGDVDFEDVAENASVCTPVPGGVGSVTTSVLAKHLLKAAKARRA